MPDPKLARFMEMCTPWGKIRKGSEGAPPAATPGIGPQDMRRGVRGAAVSVIADLPSEPSNPLP